MTRHAVSHAVSHGITSRGTNGVRHGVCPDPPTLPYPSLPKHLWLRWPVVSMAEVVIHSSTEPREAMT